MKRMRRKIGKGREGKLREGKGRERKGRGEKGREGRGGEIKVILAAEDVVVKCIFSFAKSVFLTEPSKVCC